MIADEHYFKIRKGALFTVVLIIIAFLAGFYLSTLILTTSVSPVNSSVSFSDVDKNYLGLLVGQSVIAYSDAYCEKKGLRSDLLPQVLTLTDQNGATQQVQYFVPVCVQ